MHPITPGRHFLSRAATAGHGDNSPPNVHPAHLCADASPSPIKTHRAAQRLVEAKNILAPARSPRRNTLLRTIGYNEPSGPVVSAGPNPGATLIRHPNHRRMAEVGVTPLYSASIPSREPRTPTGPRRPTCPPRPSSSAAPHRAQRGQTSARRHANERPTTHASRSPATRPSAPGRDHQITNGVRGRPGACPRSAAAPASQCEPTGERRASTRRIEGESLRRSEETPAPGYKHQSRRPDPTLQTAPLGPAPAMPTGMTTAARPPRRCSTLVAPALHR
jgi:hypothetical protein